ncbi:MAG: ZIP family metal transporter [Cellulophaga sp.]|uniref:ZIP family metal transporter n=1 Tax=unclassified Cellulophaga TaxID=2634405 RepID=UPI0026E1F89C|nr:MULTISPECIES: ZIP family metal transporter [unclassified Cellulophaga]MDO6492044.1 ZIP family metal transporter [Cellulophaga sp. 2_MG-2023]MDO6495795.1 ZIP family metal transporter [Cellulophaga sp. 3_MG-2023]
MIYILPILGVLLSFIFVYVTKPKNKEIFKLLLAFSGAFLLAITVFELFPEVYKHGHPKQVGVFIMLGILLQIFLEFFSKGAEHGHVHLNIDNVNLPWMLFISLSIHSLLEGMPLGHHHNHNFVYGILVHKIPIAIILSIFLLNSKIKLAQAILFITLFAFMTPLGSLLSNNLTILKTYQIQITALVIGVLLHISTVILFESSEGHKFNLRKLLVIIFGIAIAYFI